MILDDIAAETRRRVEELKREGYYEKIHQEMVHFQPSQKHAFYKNLAKPGLSFVN